MAKGTLEKEKVTNVILNTFEGAFLYNGGKEIRIPINDVEIKVTLTCAKDNVGGAEATSVEETEPLLEAPTEQELSEMNNYIARLNL